MRLKIVSTGEAVLRTEARALTAEEVRSTQIRELIEHMRETLHDAPGVGLAAPQVGMPMQLAVIEDKAEYHVALSKAELAERERRPVPFHVLGIPACNCCRLPKCSSSKAASAFLDSRQWFRAPAKSLSMRSITPVSRCISKRQAGMPASFSTRSIISGEPCTSIGCVASRFLPLRITTATGRANPVTTWSERSIQRKRAGHNDCQLIGCLSHYWLTIKMSPLRRTILRVWCSRPDRTILEAARYAAAGGPNQVVSASASPCWVSSPTQATYPSGRIKTAVGAVTGPIAGSSHVPAYTRRSIHLNAICPWSDVEAAGLTEVEQHRPGIVQQGEDPQRAARR